MEETKILTVTATIPPYEEARLATLRSLNLLDTPPEAEFDGLVEVVCALMDVPMAMVSFVDRDRQWFKARRGVELCETARDDSFCTHTIQRRETLVVEDATEDPRFAGLPFVAGDLGVRFYAGAPIVVEGQTVGALCCMDSERRRPTERQLSALSALAEQVAALLRARLSAATFAESERRFVAFLDHAPTVAFLKDETGRMRFVNRRFEAAFGRPSESVLGLTDYEWLPQDVSDVCARDDAAVRESRTSMEIEETLPAPGGGERLVRTFKFPVEVRGDVWVGGIIVDETELRAAQATVRDQNERLSRALEEAESAQAMAQTAALRFEQLFAGLPIACYTFDKEENIQEWNAAAERLWGIPSHLAFERWVYHTASYEESRDAQAETIRRVFAGESVLGEERLVTRLDGSRRWMLANSFPLWNARGEVVGGMSAHIDVTERKEADVLLREKEERFRTVLESLHEGILMQDEAGRIVLWNEGAERVLGLSGDQLAGRTSLAPRWRAVRGDGTDYPGEEHPIVKALRTGERQPASTMGFHLPTGELRWVNVNAAPILPEGGGAPKAAVASFLDVTEQKEQDRRILAYSRDLEEANARLEALATTDGLTELHNHRFFQDALRRKIEQCLGAGLPLSIALLDVDRFKAYNDDFGHQAGDEVLRRVARVLKEATRAEDVVARYGGEEFVIVMPGADAASACALAERVRARLAAEPFDLRAVTASVGVSTHGPLLSNAESLIRAADEALYRGKSEGRNRVIHWERMAAKAA